MPVPDDDVFPKGDVTLMSLAWNSSDSNAILVVKACSDSFNGANINCTEVKRRTGGANRRVTFTKSELAFAWGPGNEDAYAFIVIYFGGLLREGLIGGISLFRD